MSDRLSALPPNVRLELLLILHATELSCGLASTCRTLRRTCQDRVLWRAEVKRRFPDRRWTGDGDLTTVGSWRALLVDALRTEWLGRCEAFQTLERRARDFLAQLEERQYELRESIKCLASRLEMLRFRRLEMLDTAGMPPTVGQATLQKSRTKRLQELLTETEDAITQVEEEMASKDSELAAGGRSSEARLAQLRAQVAQREALRRRVEFRLSLLPTTSIVDMTVKPSDAAGSCGTALRETGSLSRDGGKRRTTKPPRAALAAAAAGTRAAFAATTRKRVAAVSRSSARDMDASSLSLGSTGSALGVHKPGKSTWSDAG